MQNPGVNEHPGLHALVAQIQQLSMQLQASEIKREEVEKKIEIMYSNDQSIREKASPVGGNCDEKDIKPKITSGEQIQLESYKAIPEFSGKQHEYGSWRNQVARRMYIIDEFKDHPKYEAALAIIRAKITGAAADVLTNNKTPYHIACILRTLDATYTDQRPLYIIEAELVSIKQNDKNLQQYYNTINFALNALIAKITSIYKGKDEQRALLIEAQRKAIRTFVAGLKSQTTRYILYGQKPITLQEAYTAARTVFYDNEHLQLERCPIMPRGQSQQRGMQFTNQIKPQNQWYQDNRANQWNRPMGYNKTESMEVEHSNRMRQSNWRQPEVAHKVEYNPSRNRFEQQQSPKFQKINQLSEMTQPIPEEMTSQTPDESTHTNMSSAFLDE